MIKTNETETSGAISIKVLFFANFKEQLDCAELAISVAKHSTIADLCDTLANRGCAWNNLFGNTRSNAGSQVKIACNQQMAELSTELKRHDQVAFFPPVTGG